MRFRVLLFRVLCIAATCFHAVYSATPAMAEDEQRIDAVYSFDYSIGQCHFVINDLQGGAFDTDNNSNPPAGGYTGLRAIDNPVAIAFCHAGANDDEIGNHLGAKKVDGKWVWLGTNEPFKPAQHFKTFAFSGNNWVGRGITYDDTTGDEAKRQRRFRFCLLQTGGPQVLCGNSSVMPLGYPKSSVLPKIRAVLKRIEFVELPTPANTGAASSASAPNQ